MEKRDYILFVLGLLVLAFGYLYSFEDTDIGGWMRGFGWGYVVALIFKTIWKLITEDRKKSMTE